MIDFYAGTWENKTYQAGCTELGLQYYNTQVKRWSRELNEGAVVTLVVSMYGMVVLGSFTSCVRVSCLCLLVFSHKIHYKL